MTREMKEKTKTTLIFVFCIVTFVSVQILMMQADCLGFTAYNGVLMACQFGLCLIMVRQDYKKGAIASLVLMAIALLNIMQALLIRRMLTPLPGLCNTLIYIVTLALLANQFRVREQEAVTDVLTGLRNRRGLYKLLKKKIEDEKEFHVLYIYLGNFKFINDNYGHSFGDTLMKEVARRMGEVVEKNGQITRMGGAEFVVLLNGDVNPEDVANRLIDRVSEKSVIERENSKVECYLTVFAGISSYPKDANNHEDLIQYADIAMYRATKDKGTVRFFDKEMKQFLNRRIELEKLIKEALKNDYFYLVYQPQYKLQGKKLRGFETLLRMKTAEGEMVSPGEFIPVAEKGDLILQIDDYVLRRAMKEFKDVVLQAGSDLTISVNVSAKNIGSIDFPRKVEKILNETGFSAKNLEIEITEYCLVESVDVTIENIKLLREMGIQVALDDFGTGYTSLSYLSKMPINLLKIDKSLVDDIEQDEKRRDFVSAVISMGHQMGCEVISEGVENESQLELLGDQKCDFIQGYVWGKPLDYGVAKKLSVSE